MSHNKYLTIPIKGMHCRSCEILLEEKLQELDGIKAVDVNYKTGEAIVHFSGQTPDQGMISKAVGAVGYEVGVPDGLPWLTNNKREYTNLGAAFLILLAVVLILKSLGLDNINLNTNLSNPSWSLIVLIGLVAGFSTCMALVGGLSLGLSTKFIANHPSATPAEKFRPHIFFVLGRILSYAWLGGILGALGTVIKLSAAANGIITLLVGAVMLLMGLQLINIFPRLNRFKLSLPKSVSKFFGINQRDKEYSHGQAMFMGALTFFLPCGFTQAMQLYAISTGNFASGALVMGLFALGTAPGLLSIGGVTSLVKGNFKERFFKVAGLAVIFFGLFNLHNGYTLASLSFSSLGISSSDKAAVVSDPNVTLENGVQVVRMTENNRGYSPNKFSLKKGVPVRWIIDAQAPYSCASALVVPKLGIQANLKAGENIIEFTPAETGQLPFSCSMGMYTGVFNVYDEAGSSASATNLVPVAVAKSPAIRSGSTCGAGGGGCGCGGCGGVKINQDTTATVAKIDSGVQIISSTYTASKYLSPNSFKVTAGKKVQLNIDVKDGGSGCGYAIMIPNLYDNALPLRAGQPITMEFTPTAKGTYDITCGMDMIRFGTIIVE